MRALLLVLALTSTAAADSARECYLHDARTKVTDVGCFDDLHATEDHTYGTRVCLVRAASGRCSGVVWFWNGDPEGKPVIVDDATCTKAGAVSFYGNRDDGAAIVLFNFTGRISKRVLRGAFAAGKDGKKAVAWKQAGKGEGFDAAATIRDKTAAACPNKR